MCYNIVMNVALLTFSMICFALTIPAVVLACIYDYKQQMIKKTIFKGLASLFVVLGCIFGFCADKIGFPTFRTLILVGTIAALIGDILLSEFAKGKVKDAFSALGLICFLGTHIFYICAFLITPAAVTNYLVFMPALGLILIITLIVLKIAQCPNLITYIGIGLYTSVAFLMVGCTINSIVHGGIPYPYVAFIGALSFMVSDFILYLINFNEKVKAKRNILFPIVLALYYIGQILIVCSVVFF